MGQDTRYAETATVEALVNAFERGAVSRRDFLRRAGLLGLTAAGAGVLADAAAPARVQAQTTQKRELVVAQGGDISKFDPHFSTSSNDIRVTLNLFDNLTSRHPDQKLYPCLATEWKATGATTWTFKLRQGVKWHNGDPFTSADAKFSIERTYDPAAKTMVATVLTTIDRVEAPDPYDPRDPHEEVGPPASGPPGVLRRTDRSEEVRGGCGAGHVQRQAGGDGAGQARVVDEGRQGGVRGERRLLGREDRGRSGRVAADPGNGAARGCTAQGRSRRDHAAAVRPLGSRQPECDDARRRRSLRGPVLPRDQRQEPAAQQRARAKGNGARRGPRGHRQGDVPGPGDRPQRTDRSGRSALRHVAAAASLRPEGGP